MFGGGWRGASSWSLSPLPCKRRSGIRDCERADWEGCNDRAIKNKSNKKKKKEKKRKQDIGITMVLGLSMPDLILQF